MKNELVTMSLLFFIFLYSQDVKSEYIVFDAARDCHKVDTMTGVRYIPNCELNEGMELKPEGLDNLPPYSNMRIANFKTMINYSFVCESLKPLSISFSLLDHGIEEFTATVAPKSDESIDVASITHAYLQAKLKIKSIDGVLGFQAMKPDCIMTVNALASYPDPVSFMIMADGFKQVEALLSFLFTMVSPSTDYVLVHSAIINGINMLELQKNSVQDPFMIMLIELTINELHLAKQKLFTRCRAGNSTEMCSQEVANVRDVLSSIIMSNNQQLSEMKDFLAEQLSWLYGQSIDLRGDLSELQNIHDRL